MKKLNSIFFIIIINIIVAYCSEVEDLKNFLINNVTPNLYEIKCNNQFIKRCSKDGNILEIQLKFGKIIKKIDFDTFPKLPYLETFTLVGDLYGGEFPSHFLELFPKLKRLQLNSSNIGKIPSDLNSDTLEELIMHNNTIKEFPYQFGKLKNLKKLNLNNNMISGSLLENANEFKNLNFLDLNNNEISSFSPDFFNGMNSLQTLKLSSNKLTELPKSIYNLNLKEFDISNNKELKAKIVNFNSVIQTCNFEGTNIECYQISTCSNLSNYLYDECSPEVIQDIKNNLSNNNNNNGSNNKLTIIIIVAVAIFGIAGFLWMYKSNKKRKNAREADIIISPTVKTSNYYDEILKNNRNNNNQNNQNNVNNINNTQSSFERILPESLSSPSSPSSPSTPAQSFSQRSQNSNINIYHNNSTTINNQNETVQGQNLTGNTSIISNQNLPSHSVSVNTSNMTSPVLSANTSIISPIMSPVSTANTSILNITSPVLQSLKLNNPDIAHVNGSNGLPNDPITMSILNNNNNNIIVNNNNLLINQNSIGFMNGQTNGQTINILPLTIRSNNGINNTTDIQIMKKINLDMAGSSSSSSGNNNNNNSNIINDYGLSIDDIEDIKLKKKILQERELSEKYNLLNNKNPNDQYDKDNNLPPYSEFQ